MDKSTKRGMLLTPNQARILELVAENERLQRENGSLARTYAGCEKMLRERTEQLNQADAENEWLRAALSRCYDRCHNGRESGESRIDGSAQTDSVGLRLASGS